MSNLLEREIIRPSVSSHYKSPSLAYRLLYLCIRVVIVLALAAGIMLLVSDVFSTSLPHAPGSAAPLLLVGAASLGFHVLTRPGLLDLFKALIASFAFILWGIDQLLPQGWFATTLGDVVIVLYVFDLGWMMMDRLKNTFIQRD